MGVTRKERKGIAREGDKMLDFSNMRTHTKELVARVSRFCKVWISKLGEDRV